MATETYQQDRDGNIIDPPILGDHERRIVDAQAAGDDNLVHVLQNRYHNDRKDIVGELERADEDEDGPDLQGDLSDPESLTTNNNYDDLRTGARARGLPTTGGKIDLAGRIAEHERGGGTATPATDPPPDDTPDDDPTQGGDNT